MNLYTVYENGALRTVTKVDFSDNKVYIIDDEKKIYVWVGLKSSEKKREFGQKKAEILNQKKKKPIKVELLEQNKEYGSFLAIMDLLMEGIDEITKTERRNELILKVEETKELIEAGLDPDLEAEITILANEISLKNKPYEELSRNLAQKQLVFINSNKKINENDIKKKNEEILKSSTTYEELCWLLAQLEILKKRK